MVIQRILSFPATEPVAKFLAGLELLLDRCQHWEAKAHSGVSLQPQLEQISRLVLDWRRLELAQWTTALDAVQRDAARSATGWWLHLFTSVHQLLAQGAAAPLPALMAALQRWMEAGSLGTFGAGLALLETMERHFARLPGGRNTTGRDVVCCVLRNIRGFYGQFAGDVEQLVSSRRAAIEKELKNFVKIARWSDMNYFSLEQTVKKSHRKVMDLMRQFANVLDERVSLVKPSGNLSVFVAPDLNVVLRGLKTSSAEAVPARLLVKIANLPALTQRSAVLVRRICRRLPLSTAAAAVAAIGDQAAIRWNELDEPALPTEMPVEKKKAALKALIQRRRLAYTDVKKQLQEIGASWRKGCGIQRSLEDFTGALSGVALNASLTAPRDACLQLFQRVLAQMAVFQRQLEKPFQGIAGEAGVMKGLVQHLHALILQQAHSAAEMAGKMTPLGGFLRGMARPAVDPAWPVIVGKDCLQLLKKAQSIVCSLQGAAEQYRLILDAVPEKQTNETVMDLLYAEDSERPLIVEKNTEQWNSAEQLLKNILSTVEKHRGVIVQHASTLPPLGGPAELALLHALRADLPGLRQAFSSLHDKFGCFPHGAELLRDLDDFSAELASGNPSAEGAEQWADPLGKLIVAALKGVQNMLPTTKLSENSDGELNIAVLTDNIGHWQNLLNIARVGQRLNNFVTGANRSVWDTALNQLIALADVVVNNYSVLAGAVLRDAFALMAGTSRLLLHLLELFGQIVAQGFGSGKVPEEEESDGKGEKFEEVEQAGLGEGEGTKDVSQEIESEDQLEESHVAGEKKEPEVQPNAPAEEEHGVEMSEDFDAEMDDVQRAEQDEINEDDAEDEKEDDKLDQQMGDLGDDEDNIDNLDEEVWRDDAEAEEEDDDTQDKKEVNGKGQAQADQQKLVAKDDNLVQGEEKQQGDDTPAETEAEPTTDQEMNEQDVENDGKPTEDLMPENVDENPEDDEMDGEEEKIPEDGENAEEAPEAAPDEEMSGVAETEEKAPEMQQDQNMQPPASANGNDEAQTAETGTEGHGQSLLDFPKENLNESEQDADAENETGTQGAALDALGRERGQRGAQSTPANAKNKKSQPKKKSAEPQKRTLGDPCQAARKRRRVVENSGTAVDELKEQAEADAYEHVASDSEQLDAQAVDVGSHDEALQQKLDGMQLDGDEEEDVPEEAMQEDEETPPDEAPLKDAEKLKSAGKKEKNSREKTAELIGEEERVETEGEFVRTADTDQPEESFFHTQREYLQRHLLTEEEAEKLRKELAEQTSALLQPAQSVLSAEQRQTGMELWRKYEMLTAGLAYELCEQLRLVLEPTKKAKMRGDYRSGKRLNMRRVIAYVASEFRKDKIWLRRSLPSQRQYQILLAVDDSASMADNRTKELAFESVAVIRQALSLLQVGEVGVCRFGQGVEMLLPLGGGASGSSEDAAAMLSRFTFAQKRTNVPLMLESVAGVFQAARTRLLTVPSVAQLLLIVSDGRGVFQDGDERVERAVRSVVGAGVFVVFLILDNPTANPTKQNDESIVKHEKVILHDKGLPTQRVERRSYMQCFPFPFYLVLRSVRQLPNTLCDALRQWFELIAAQD
ncbi:midasin-like isoform X4 [Paramacrobiotus metropolitanus]|uniref:midasin-like isoform X4 n=1 Tax=Paramacrobiotus metropolitanus TaxID=2943436 RepID=UPI002445620C|nr:midasin-like isoform X4 [Paramacrobiotus metropolitanus]